MAENILEIHGLKKNYKSFTLGELSLELPRGVVLGLVGANGAGKTTLMKLILGLTRPDGGTIRLLGGTPANDRLRETIGVVYDELPVHGMLTSVKVGRVMAGIYRGWDAEGYRNLCQKLELPDGKEIKDFSRGMKMKLSIAIALSHRAELLLLDEPTGGLDPIVRNEILDLFRDFMQDERHSILISSHITSDLSRMADYIAFLDRGQLLLTEDKDTLIEQYGLVRGKKNQWDEMKAGGFLGLREESYGYEALCRNREQTEADHPELVVGRADLDEIMGFVVGEARK